MSITLTVGAQVREGMIRSEQWMSESTATVYQLINTTDDITYLGAGTSTGDNSANLYRLQDAEDGQIKWIGFGSGTAATGEAALLPMVGTGTSATGVTNLFRFSTDAVSAAATGLLVFTTASDYVRLQYTNNSWNVLSMVGATWSTGT